MKPKIKQLKNGLTMIVVPMKDNPTVTVMTLVATGSKYETKENNGISHFLEHMCFKGTTQRPDGMDISRELDGLGAASNAFTGQEYTGYWAKGRAKHASRLLDVVADVYLNSTFPDAEMQKEKGVILDEINMYEDLPMRKVHNVLGQLLYGDQPAGWTILGPKENIKNMTREDFVRYHTEHYVAKATTIVIAGGVDPKKTFKEIEQQFAAVSTKKKHPKKKVIEKQSRPAVALEYKKTDQAHLVMAFRTVARKHKDARALSLLAGLLGAGMSSRLFERIREKMGVGYYVRAYHDTSTDHGALEIATGVTHERVYEVVEAILEECRRMITEPVSPAELKKIKEYTIGNMQMGIESSDELAQFYGFQQLLGNDVKTPQQIIKEIKALTAKDIQRVAKKYFTNERLNLAVIGPFKKADQFKKRLKI
jgi:predicted Zn-dependent peptidase